MELILLERVFVTDLDEFTSQWREYLFDPNDPDGDILENLVINSTAFEMTFGQLVWTNPLTGDTYTYNGDGGVNKTAGDGPIFTPPPPDLADYGLRFVLEYFNWNQETVREEIYKRDYVGAVAEVEGGQDPFLLNYENAGKVFVPFRGSRATVTLKSNISKYFSELFDGDERDFYLIHKVDGVSKWTGWITPDNFSEVYGNAPYMTVVNFSDGIGMAKKLDFPDVNSNGFTGTVSEKDALCAALRQIAFGLEVRIAANLMEDGMDLLSAPIEQSNVNMETFTKTNQGEVVPLSVYDSLDKILRSWNAVLVQEDNIWWIYREPELYGTTLNYKRFNPDGTAIGTGTKSLENTFASSAIKLHRATLQTVPAFKNIAVSQEYGDLLVENNNFAINGSFDRWTPIFYDGGIRSWKLIDWKYVNLSPRIRIGGNWSGHVWRYTESTGLNEVNNYLNIHGVVRNFTDVSVGYLESKPAFVRQEIGNVLRVNFKARCNTSTTDQRLVEAYFNIAVKCGTQWLNWTEETGTLEWTGTETRIRWKVAEVMRWESISIPAVPIPEDGDLVIRIYQMVQVGSVSKVVYRVDFDEVELILADNPALLNQRIYYKTINDKTFTSEVEEIKIQLGDVATVLSQNAKIVDGQPTARWKRASETSVPLAQLIAQEWVNQTNVSRYRLSGGTCRTPLSFLATYEDDVNEEGKKFILTGGSYREKSGEWKPDFHEINQTEVSITIRAVTESRDSKGTGQGAGVSDDPDEGSESPQPPSVPLDLGDEDDVIPIIKDGKFEDSKIIAVRGDEGEITQHQFINPVKGLPAQNDDEFVTKAQLPVIVQYGLLNGGAIQWRGDGLWFQWAAAAVAIGGPLTAPFAEIELTAADPTLNREDLLGWLKTGPTTAVAHVITGTPGPTFSPPPYDPTTFVVGISVKIPAAATVPDGTIVTENVYIDNAEWTVSKTGTGTLDADSTDNPSTGTKAVKSTTTANNYRVRFTRPTVLDLSTLPTPTLGMDLALIAAMQNNMNLAAVFLDDTGTAISSQVNLTFNKALLTYQFVAIDLAAFSFTSQNVKHLELIFTRSGGGTFAGFYLDNVKLQGGVEQPVGTGIPEAPSDDVYYGRRNGTWQAVTEEAPNDGQEYVRKNKTWAAPSGGGGADANAVHYNAADGKTASEKQTARQNIGLFSADPTLITTSVVLRDTPRPSNFIIGQRGINNDNLYSFEAGTPGEQILFYSNNSVTGYGYTLRHEDATSVAENRLYLPGGEFKLLKGQWVIFTYDAILLRWVLGTPFSLANNYFLGLNQFEAPSSAVVAMRIFSAFANNTHELFGIYFNTTEKGISAKRQGIEFGKPLVLDSGSGISTQDGSGVTANFIWNSLSNTAWSWRQNGATYFGLVGGNPELSRLLSFKSTWGGTLTASIAPSTGRIFHARSGAANESIRRDEKRIYELVTVTTAGAINDQALTDGVFNYRFTACTSLTGLGNGEIGRKLTIHNENTVDMILEHEDAGSIAANRFNLIGAADITVPTKGKVEIIYCTGNRWELVSKNF